MVKHEALLCIEYGKLFDTGRVLVVQETVVSDARRKAHLNSFINAHSPPFSRSML